MRVHFGKKKENYGNPKTLIVIEPFLAYAGRGKSFFNLVFYFAKSLISFENLKLLILE
jgi:hypothetical protein